MCRGWQPGRWGRCYVVCKDVWCNWQKQLCQARVCLHVHCQLCKLHGHWCDGHVSCLQAKLWAGVMCSTSYLAQLLTAAKNMEQAKLRAGEQQAAVVTIQRFWRVRTEQWINHQPHVGCNTSPATTVSQCCTAGPCTWRVSGSPLLQQHQASRTVQLTARAYSNHQHTGHERWPYCPTIIV